MARRRLACPDPNGRAMGDVTKKGTAEFTAVTGRSGRSGRKLRAIPTLQRLVPSKDGEVQFSYITTSCIW
jgi:hypothetical protein